MTMLMMLMTIVLSNDDDDYGKVDDNDDNVSGANNIHGNGEPDQTGVWESFQRTLRGTGGNPMVD